MEHPEECNCDQCLLAQMMDDDCRVRQSGWEAWYSRDATAMLAIIKRYCSAAGFQDHSEDILQDCFLIGFRNVARGKYTNQDKGLRAYLSGVAQNLVRELSRLHRREVVILDEHEEKAAVCADLDDSIYLQEVLNIVGEAYAQRPDVYRCVIRGIYAEGKTSSQVAVELGKNRGNVRAIAHRAVREIGHHIKQKHHVHLSAEAIRACLTVL